jgi:putative ATP-binding cassette transporter
MPSHDRSTWSRLKTVGLPFFKAPDNRRRALGGLAVLIVLLLCINAVNVVNSYIGRDFMTALAERQAARFFVFAGIFAGVFAVSTIVEVFSRYAEQWLGVVWREWLTRRFLDRYLANQNYFRLAERHEVDNPDERISLDIQTFTMMMLSILIMLFNGIMTLAAFSWVLWSITPWLFLVAYGYAGIGLLGTIVLGRRLTLLNNQQIQREADFRYGLGRLREHGEAVARAGEEEQARGRLSAGLTSLVQNFLVVIRVNRSLGFFITAFNYMPQIIPAVVVAPLYIRGAVQFGAVTQAAMAFAQVQGVFSIFETQYQQLTTFAAVVGRLGALWEATDPSQKSSADGEPPPRNVE